MPANLHLPERWDEDIIRSVKMYNRWFLEFAPQTFVEARIEAATATLEMMKVTDNLRKITPDVLKRNPLLLASLRMVTAPPIARERLVGLSGVKKSLVETMERKGRLPSRISEEELDRHLQEIGSLVTQLADPVLFPWLDETREPTKNEVMIATTVVGDRLCGAISDPIIRNAQEARQLGSLSEWLDNKGYHKVEGNSMNSFKDMIPGTYAIRLVAEGKQIDDSIVKIPTDLVIMKHHSSKGDIPILIEAKSAGDFTNVNKRRKEEAKKIDQLRRNYGEQVPYILFLCGYFNTQYLEYEAKAGIDWVWEHRISDLEEYDV